MISETDLSMIALDQFTQEPSTHKSLQHKCNVVSALSRHFIGAWARKLDVKSCPLYLWSFHKSAYFVNKMTVEFRYGPNLGPKRVQRRLAKPRPDLLEPPNP
eukprot:4449080-Amphidinium_carterae.1